MSFIDSFSCSEDFDDLGLIKQHDQVKEITQAFYHHKENKYFFRVVFKTRSDGSSPRPVDFSIDYMRQNFPLMLIEFLEKVSTK
jgi:hypothetical protein